MSTVNNAILNRWLVQTARQGACDLCLAIGSPPIIRQQGHLTEIDRKEITHDLLENIAIELLSAKDYIKLYKKNKVVFLKTFNKFLRFNVYVYKNKESNNCSSIIFKHAPVYNNTVSDLGLPQSVEDAVRFKKGLTIVTGLPNSEKQKTVLAILNTLNTLGPARYINIISSIAPDHKVLSSMCSLDYLKIGQDVASYRHGINTSFNKGVDTIVLDGICDKSAKRMLKVLDGEQSVILKTDAITSVGALERILSFFDGMDLAWAQQVLSGNLVCVFCQKMIPKIEKGLSLCYELLFNNDTISSFIKAGNIQHIAEVIKEQGRCFNASLARLVLGGDVAYNTALAEASNSAIFKKMLQDQACKV